MNSKKMFDYQSVTMTEVINFVGISFNVHVHMWAEVLKDLCFQSFHFFFGGHGSFCPSVIIIFYESK